MEATDQNPANSAKGTGSGPGPWTRPQEPNTSQTPAPCNEVCTSGAREIPDADQPPLAGVLQKHRYREQAREARLARATAQTTSHTRLSPSTAAGHTFVGPPPSAAAVGTGSAARGRRLVVLQRGKLGEREDFWWNTRQETSMPAKDELTDSLSKQLGPSRQGSSRVTRSRVPPARGTGK